MKRHKLIDFLSQVSEFSPKEKSLIFNAIENREALKGEYLLKCNEICTEVNFVLTGVVRFFITNEKGKELTTTFISEGEVAARIESFLRGIPSNGCLQCETYCEFITITRKNLDFLCENTKNFGYAMGQLATIAVAKKMEMQRRLLTQEAKESYIDFLKHHENVADRVPAYHLSSYLGITPSSLSRIKKK